MSDLFLDVLNTSIAASWVVLAVVLARLALKKAPRNLVCGLWVLVALRLVVGEGIEAPFSLMPSAQAIPPQSLYDAAPVIDSGVPIIDRVVNPVYTEAFRAVPDASVNPLQVFVAITAHLWLLGVAAMLVWALWSWLRIRRQVRESIPAGDRVFLCDRIDSPFIFGFFVPKIYLPSGLEDAAKTHVIAHERAHIARRDHWWKPLGFGLLTVNWFNPVMWLAYILLCRDIEMACDERVVRDLSLADKKAYSAALLDCSVTQRFVSACPLAFGEVGVKERVKSVLHYKKPAFWVMVITLIVAAVLAVGFLTSPVSDSPEIRYNGALYIQDGEAVDFIGDKFQTVTELQSVLRDSTLHPGQNGQAVRLGQEYAGQPMYVVGNILYLEEPGGGSWLKFRMKTGEDYLLELLGKDVLYHVQVQQDGLIVSENLSRSDALILKRLLSEILHSGTSLAADAFPRGTGARISFYLDDGAQPAYLERSEEQWQLCILDEEYGTTVWSFSSELLDSFLTRYQADSAYAAEALLPLAPDTAVNPVQLHYQSYTQDDLCLRIGIPTVLTDAAGTVTYWEIEAVTPGFRDDYLMGLRCRPEGREDWMTLYYFPETAEYASSIHQAQQFTYPSGVSGTKHFTESPDHWEVLQLDTTQGQLIAKLENAETWTDWDRQIAAAILGTVTIRKGGNSLMTLPNRLGIHLSVEDVTPSGLTLVCTQDGTPWNAIYTGTPFSVARWEAQENDWVFLPVPENTAWTTVAYHVPQSEITRYAINWTRLHGELEPGRYRIYKGFSGEMLPPGEQPSLSDTVNQTYFAEFTIE